MRRIVVLDDEPVLRFVICAALRDAGFDAVSAGCGGEVLKWLEGGYVPEAMVVDLLMPGMGGMEFLRRLRANPTWQAIPVVLVTGAIYSRDAFPPRAAYQALLYKPFGLRELVDVVERALQ